jgi:ElaB/YqjD/DUF883 family membrane-anchored ribosome-binding protein
MVHQPEVTRAQMGETRAALSQKIESLEQQVVDSVHDAAHAVAQTVERVGDAVNETVENVTDNLDIRLQVERHPWAMVGGALALGYVGGYLLLRHGPAPHPPNGSRLPAPADGHRITEQPNGGVKDAHVNDAHVADRPSGKSNRELSRPALGDGWLSEFAPEIAKLKGLAIGTLLSAVRNMVTQAAPPEMQAGLEDVIDGITVKLGGDPVHHPPVGPREAVA